MDVYPSRSNVWTTLVVFAGLSVVAAFLAVDAVAHGASLRGWSRRLFLDLRSAVEAPTGATRKYLSGAPFSIPVESDGQLRLPLWGSKEKVLEEVGRYDSAV